ncbi:class I SAM-dependent methyltransferase [Candidatus Thorarchaeota archaeon]|nr:MAG: class I SAM-dependent methyltransferase [Candidatus Thorarchaeota archaeon]
MDVLKKHDAQRILDVGCGSGRHLVYLAEQGFDAFGFDSSPQAVKMASAWLDDRGLPAHVIVRRMEERFPYRDSFFDGVISIQVIHHNLMSDIRFTVGEITRVLRAGGILFASFPILGPTPAGGGWNLEEIEPGTYLPHDGLEAGIPHHYFTVDEISDVFSAFEILEQYIDDTDHRCILARRKQQESES